MANYMTGEHMHVINLEHLVVQKVSKHLKKKKETAMMGVCQSDTDMRAS